MTPDLTTITTPFGLLDEKTQAQLRAAQSAGMKIEFHDAIRWRWASKMEDYFAPAVTYRLAPAKSDPSPIHSAPDAVARLVEAANQARLALAGYVSAQSAIDKLDAALAARENEQCQVSIEPATGVTTNGLHGSGADAPVAGGNSHPDAVAGRPCKDCGHTHDTDGDLCPTCVCVRAESAAMEKDHD